MNKFEIGDKVVVLGPASLVGVKHSILSVGDIVSVSNSTTRDICEYLVRGDSEESSIWWYDGAYLQLKSEYDMKNKKEVKPIPFDMERAKNGDKIINRKGNSVRILAFDRISIAGNYPIVALHNEINGEKEYLSEHGPHGTAIYDSLYDLFMAPVEKTEWIAVIKHIETGESFIGSISAGTEEELIRGYESSSYGIVCTKKITWEE